MEIKSALTTWPAGPVGWFPGLADTGLRQVSWPSIEPHRDYIAAQLKVGVTAATVHQRLRDEHGLGASVASLRRWVRANLPEEARRGQVTVLRDTPPPGSEGQIDYGKLGSGARTCAAGSQGAGGSAGLGRWVEEDVGEELAGPCRWAEAPAGDHLRCAANYGEQNGDRRTPCVTKTLSG